MTAFSILALMAQAPVDADGDPTAEYFAVGTHPDGRLILHFAPGADLPDDAQVLCGPAPWSWGQFATQFPALVARTAAHEWAGESTAYDLPTE
jgi:hypothetical protein